MLEAAVNPHYEDAWLTVYLGDCREVLAAMEPESVQTVITSPPYFGLRDYGLPPAVWGDRSDPLTHVHEWLTVAKRAERSSSVHWQHTEGGGTRSDGSFRNRHANASADADDAREWGPVTTGNCACGAWLGTLGLEPTPELWVEHIVEVFQAVRRVLRRDGTVWLNVGDAYNGTGRRGPNEQDGQFVFRAGVESRNVAGFKAKDRMMMPARVAIALQADGWWLRDEVVWHKPNPMPSSVADRTTPAHEMVYLLSKSGRYHYDADAIRERGTTTRPELLEFGPRPDRGHSNDRRREKVPGGWMVGPGTPSTIHTEGRTSATYRDKTAENPRIDGRRQAPEPGEPNAFHPLGRNKRSVWTIATQPYAEAHFATFPEKLVEPMILAGCPVDGVVLDPFGGSGTVAMVANRLGRRAVHIDLSDEYTAQAIERIAEARGQGDGPAIDMPVPFAGDGLWAEGSG